MLSERERRALLRDLMVAAKRLLAGIRSKESAEVSRALEDAREARRAMCDGYACDMSVAFDRIEEAMQVVSKGSPADGELKALRDAVDSSHGHVEGPVASGGKWIAHYYGGGVRIVITGEPERQCLDVDAAVLRNRFGAPLVGALLRVMAGVSRIAALLHFIKLNSKYVGPDGIAFERNFHFAALLTFAYLKELSEALNGLSAAGIKRHLTDQDPWRQLQELERYWVSGKRSTVRDQVMFHLGNAGDVAATVTAHAEAGWLLPLFETDSDSTGMPMRFTAGEAAVMTASGLTLADFVEIATNAVASYGPLVTSVMCIMDDLLRQCGARLPGMETRSVTLLWRETSKTDAG
jgi:hypothetical protein